MRIRSIRPEFWRSLDISALDWDARLVFVGLWSYVDDNGVGVDQLSAICAELFAEDMVTNPAETVAKVSRALDDISNRGLIVRYEVDGKRYLAVTKFLVHQRVDKPSKSRYPEPPAIDKSGKPLTSDYGDTREGSRNTPGTLPEGSTPGEGEKGRRGEGEKSLPSGESAPANASGGNPKRGTRLPADWRPTPEDQELMAAEYPGVKLITETRKFADYWAGVPGAKGVKLDWNATWRNWIRRAGESRGTASASPAVNGAPVPNRHEAKVNGILERGQRLADAADQAYQDGAA